MKLFTNIEIPECEFKIGLNDKVFVLGSCFADNIGVKLSEAGIDVCTNPFGTLYNPVSIADAVKRLNSGTPFNMDDCVEMGAGANLICSYHHHTSFARIDAETFLAYANKSLSEATDKWKSANIVIITCGTSRCWCHDGQVVANCLKRPGYEFSKKILSPADVGKTLSELVLSAEGKRFIFTVSPIRHLGEGAHLNQISKSTLLLGTEQVLGLARTSYFPAYEIFMDELRDYRFCAEDLAHPTAQAVEYIWERFKPFAFRKEDLDIISDAEKTFRHTMHRPNTIK